MRPLQPKDSFPVNSALRIGDFSLFIQFGHTAIAARRFLSSQFRPGGRRFQPFHPIRPLQPKDSFPVNSALRAGDFSLSIQFGHAAMRPLQSEGSFSVNSALGAGDFSLSLQFGHAAIAVKRFQPFYSIRPCGHYIQEIPLNQFRPADGRLQPLQVIRPCGHCSQEILTLSIT